MAMTASAHNFREEDAEAHEFVPGPLGADELRKTNAYWSAANYLSIGQVYLLDNPLSKSL